MPRVSRFYYRVCARYNFTVNKGFSYGINAPLYMFIFYSPRMVEDTG